MWTRAAARNNLAAACVHGWSNKTSLSPLTQSLTLSWTWPTTRLHRYRRCTMDSFPEMFSETAWDSSSHFDMGPDDDSLCSDALYSDLASMEFDAPQPPALAAECEADDGGLTQVADRCCGSGGGGDGSWWTEAAPGAVFAPPAHCSPCCDDGCDGHGSSSSDDWSDEELSHLHVHAEKISLRDSVATPPSSPDEEEEADYGGQRREVVHSRMVNDTWLAMAAQLQPATTVPVTCNYQGAPISLPPRPVPTWVQPAAAAAPTRKLGARKPLAKKRITKKSDKAAANTKKKKRPRQAAGAGAGLACSCPFCGAMDTPNTLVNAADSGEESEGTIQDNIRRHRRKMKKPRQSRKMGVWWRKYGYSGQPYCQRCSEIFRDHIIRGFSNSCKCSRESPCQDCNKILQHFPVDREELFASMDRGGGLPVMS